MAVEAWMLTRVGASENNAEDAGKSRESRLFSACASDQRGGLVYAVYSLSVYCMCKTDQMKHLLTAIACFFALSISAQTPVTYNPDSDGDNFIGVADLTSLLSEFGTTFSPFFYNSEIVPLENDEGIFTAEDFAPVFLCDARELEGAAQIDVYDFQPCEVWVIYEMNQGIDVSLTCSIWDEFGIATYYHDWFPPPPTGSAIASVGFGYYSFETGSSDNTNDAPIIMMQKFLVLNNEIMTIK